MRKFLSLFLVLILSLTFFTACDNQANQNTENNKQENQVNDNEKAPVTDTEENNEFKESITFNGSSTLAPVISALSTDFIEDNETWDKVDSKFPEKNIAVYVSAGGSGSGAKSVIDGTSDFGMLAREVKDTEKEQIENMQEIKLGIDALTVSINPENPLNQVKDDLSTEEIKKIFSGEYKKWNELDSSLPDTDIVVVIRDLGGGAHEVFQKNVMGETEVKKDAIQAPSMGALVTKIIENKDAIGYASFGMVNQNEGKLVPLKVDSVEPTKENIIDGSYKISRPLIAIKKGELTDVQQAFIDYLKSEKSSKIIEELGFIPVN